MRNMTEAELTEVVLQRYQDTPDPRLREILQSLIRHLHAFVRDVRLTEEEWLRGILYLTAVGQISDDKRQEMILLSDNVGVSMLVNMVSAGVAQAATESTVVGPFYVPGTPERQWGESIQQLPCDDAPLFVRGRVLDLAGEPVADAQIEVWQTNSNGMYDIQDPEQPEHNLRGWYRVNADGEFLVRTVRPVRYPIPTDGPIGELLNATSRHPWRPAHLHVKVTAAGCKPLVTHIFDAEDPYLDSDVVFAVKQSLVRKFEPVTASNSSREYGISGPCLELRYDFTIERTMPAG
ncbi:hydroxyquinol 1,2-dioxygenase ChqB (plasmid) [Cupriavidus necator N-1]|uniref:Hydroxyquinol 1,2-dioxygenase ChqB n=1 Tax=Cupriavidus necator (strain ATCC 43291 / DSM 13513 / CCUG 52238 / LMG 8453 / N-1) TaxID=1042878 RepID=F8GY88_CUPNN|nr:intradiol ring-cleavage dioxygenase [Cupriavidus necator]AEI82829.1 hydroxyquinol 1,2-dioxygenase ChqB [Cupriavidus necator N-1]MDX6008625.1 intradiol ring-cleavage dioxygenase [Cupriavidus necator]